MQIEWKWCNGFSRDNFKHKLHTVLQPLGGGTTPLPMVYYVPLHGDYIQMLLFFKIPKWESQD
jgi:hypothetical protein